MLKVHYFPTMYIFHNLNIVNFICSIMVAYLIFRVSPEKPGTPIDELSCFSTTVTAPLSPQPNQLFSSAMPSKPANAPKKLDFSFGHSTLLSTSMTRPLDTSGVSLIPEKSPASSIPAFYLPTSEPAPIIGTSFQFLSPF